MGQIIMGQIYIPFDTSYHFDGRLHEVPNAPDEMEQALDFLQEQLDSHHENTVMQMRLYGLIGVYARILGDFPRSRTALMNAIALSRTLEDQRSLALNLLRLAQVYQWQKQYSLSERLLSEAFEQFSNHAELRSYLDFACQYAGKYHFERGNHEKASHYFQQALAIRWRKGDRALICATQLTLEILQQQRPRATEQTSTEETPSEAMSPKRQNSLKLVVERTEDERELCQLVS